MVAGNLADAMTDGTPTEPVRHWLDTQGWHNDDQYGLVCAEHPTASSPS